MNKINERYWERRIKAIRIFELGVHEAAIQRQHTGLKLIPAPISITASNVSSCEKMEHQFFTLPLINGAFKAPCRRLKFTPY